MEQRQEFVLMANQENANISRLCEQFGISRKTGYKWLARYLEAGFDGLKDQDKRPKSSPNRTIDGIEQYVIALREKDPEWGAKKLYRIICNHKHQGVYPFDNIPCKTTISKILDRHNLIDRTHSRPTKEYQRFEYAYPNELWQMDYKGQFTLLNKKQCFPLTITDDHSRFNICLSACLDQRDQTVSRELTRVFRQYGLPNAILADNGPPWGPSGSVPTYGSKSFTRIDRWLIQLNVRLIHGRPYHPQTQGKEERFHRTLKQELLNYQIYRDHNHCQSGFDKWRFKFNCERPHEGIDFDFPAQRYQPSIRPFPEKIKPYQYDSHVIKKKANESGRIIFKGKQHSVGQAFRNEIVALSSTQIDGQYEIYFCNQLIRTITL